MSESNESQKPLDFDLRTRIAKVLHRLGACRDDVEEGWVWTWEQESEEEQRGWLDDADVLIAELGLPPTWGRPSFENGSNDD